MASRAPITVTYFSDILCIWAYCAQARVDEVRARFPDQVIIDYRFISVFGNCQRKIGSGWKERGGFAGYDAHVHEIAERFVQVKVRPGLWKTIRPASSASPHLFLKAVALAGNGSGSAAGTMLEKTAWAFRRAFFRDARDIAQAEVQWQLAEELDLPQERIDSALKDGTAMAALCEDYELQREHNIEGSPTLVLDNGRQKLFGNVGYRVIEANILELLHTPKASQASWC